MNESKLLAVIHHLDANTSIEQAKLALNNGAAGVFLISHHVQDDELYEPAMVIKGLFPESLVGLNLLSSPPLKALEIVSSLNLDMVWCDAPGITSTKVNDEAYAIRDYLINQPSPPLFFGSVAFKYQVHEPAPDIAALLAHGLSMLPTTSGKGTGTAPDLEKIASMKKSIGHKACLAVASGMTSENVSSFLPYVHYLLVSTGISKDAYHFDEAAIKRFVSAMKSEIV